MDYTFSDLINVSALQQIATNIYLSAGIPIGIIGSDDITYVASGWQDICTQFHRVHPETKQRCMISDQYIKNQLYEKEFIEYKCLNGLTDIAQPIIINGQHIATVFLGQFFYDDETIDYDFFLLQGRHFGFDEVAYIEALRKVPRFSHKKVKYILAYYKGLIITLIESSLLRIQNTLILQEVQVREERLRSYLHSIDDLVFVIDKKGFLQECISPNSQYLDPPSSVSPDTLIGKHIRTIFPADIVMLFEDAIHQIRIGKEFQQFEYSLSHENKKLWFLARITNIKKSIPNDSHSNDDYTDYDNEYIAVIRDISDIKKNEELIKQMAYYDHLTGLYNRNMFFETLSDIISNSKTTKKTFAILFLDLDDFKKVNDTKGHHFGDLLLYEIGRRLKSAIRKGDTIARMGGDEFIIITEHYIKTDELTHFLERLLEALSLPFLIEDHLINTTFSIGIAIYPNDGDSSHELIKNADASMYIAKEMGKNRYHFYANH